MFLKDLFNDILSYKCTIIEKNAELYIELNKLLEFEQERLSQRGDIGSFVGSYKQSNMEKYRAKAFLEDTEYQEDEENEELKKRDNCKCGLF